MRVRYVGFSQERAAEAFEALRPYRAELIRLSGACRPFSDDWKLFYEAQLALDRAAARFTGDPDFFHLKPAVNQDPLHR